MADPNEYELACQLRMESALQSVRQTLSDQDKAIADIRTVQEAHAKQLEEGTYLIVGLDKKLTTLMTETKPVTEAVQNMQAGIRVLGRLGRVTGKLAEWTVKFAKVGVFLVGLFFFIKSILLGQSFAGAWADLIRYVK